MQSLSHDLSAGPVRRDRGLQTSRGLLRGAGGQSLQIFSSPPEKWSAGVQPGVPGRLQQQLRGEERGSDEGVHEETERGAEGGPGD